METDKFNWIEERLSLRKQFIDELEKELSVLVDRHNKQFEKIDQELTVRINITSIIKTND